MQSYKDEGKNTSMLQREVQERRTKMINLEKRSVPESIKEILEKRTFTKTKKNRLLLSNSESNNALVGLPLRAWYKANIGRNS
jgi:hypothetical protein